MGMADEARRLADEEAARAADDRRQKGAQRDEWLVELRALAVEYAKVARDSGLTLDHKSLFGGWWKVSITFCGGGDVYSELDLYINRDGSIQEGYVHPQDYWDRNTARLGLTEDLARRMALKR